MSGDNNMTRGTLEIRR